MDSEPTLATLDSERPSARDIWEVARLPALFAIITATITWLIWYYTNTPCTLELAERTSCNPATIAGYINVDVFGRMLTYSAVTAAAGGVWNYNMFTRMRAVIAAERQRADSERSRADEATKQLEGYRQQVDEERRQERQAFFDALTEERGRWDEERRQMQQQADEERRQMQQQAAENQQAFMAALSEITAQVAYLAQQRNGSNGDERNGS